MVRWLWPGTFGKAAGYGAPALDPSLSTGEGLVLEALLTAFLVFVVFATAADIRGAFKMIAGFAIGLTVTVDVMVGGPLTGAMMNPARAFGSHVVDNNWTTPGSGTSGRSSAARSPRCCTSCCTCGRCGRRPRRCPRAAWTRRASRPPRSSSS